MRRRQLTYYFTLYIAYPTRTAGTISNKALITNDKLGSLELIASKRRLKRNTPRTLEVVSKQETTANRVPGK